MAKVKKSKQSFKKSTDRKKKQNKERVRKFRQKMTSEQLEEKRRKDRERYQKKKEQGLVKNINQCTEQEKTDKRKIWRKATTTYRQKLKLHMTEQNVLENETPPQSDDEGIMVNIHQLTGSSSSRRERGRKKLKRNRTQTYRQLKKAEEKISVLQKRVNKYKKKLSRLSKPKVNNSSKKLTPLTKVTEMIKDCHNVPANIRRRLLFGEVLEQQLVENMNSLKKEKDKQIIKKAVSGDMLKKYHVIGEAKNIVSYKQHKKFRDNLSLSQYDRKVRRQLKTQNLKACITEFLEREGNSEMRPGKKDYITKNKITKQRRILLNPMKHLYKIFVSETNLKISLKTFYRLKPFWIIRPKWSDRQTCGCIKHSNFQLIVNSLFSSKVLASKNIETVISEYVCDIGNMKCMFSACIKCGKRSSGSHLVQRNLSEVVTLFQWENVSEKKVIKGKTKVVKRMTKSRKLTTVSSLVGLFKRELIIFKKHFFIMKHQMQKMRHCKNMLQNNELMIHIDFSENYILKYSSEVQSMHFGASKKQLSLHTGLYYFRNPQDESAKVEGIGFCSVSENIDHQAHAIWAHMKNILEKLSRDFPNTNTINFFSDGPSSQYRNRSNIYLLLTKVPRLFQHLKSISWNFSASGHGKGPMDGIGGALKRNADSLVLHGQDIFSAKCFVEHMKESKVEVWEVPSSEIEKAKSELPLNIRSIPSIMKVHQITWDRDNKNYIFLREVSCFECNFGTECSHFGMKSGLEFIPKTSCDVSTTISLVNKPDTTQVESTGIYTDTLQQIDDTQNAREHVESNMDDTATQMKINIISVVQLPSLVINNSSRNSSELKNNVVYSGICFICTFNFSVKNMGVNCFLCRRAYHMRCAVANKLPIRNCALFCLECADDLR